MMERRRAGVSLFDLMEADLLPAGTILRPHEGSDSVATLLPDGRLACGDEIYSGPEDAAAALAGETRDGWSFWLADTPDGAFTLAALREAYTGMEV